MTDADEEIWEVLEQRKNELIVTYIMSLLIIVTSCNVPIRFISKLSLVLGVVPQDKKLSPESTGQAFGEAWQALGG